MTPDEKLSALLQTTRGLEPSPDFENAVWDRIHTADRVAVRGWRDWSVPLALAAGLLLGIGMGVFFPASGKTSQASPTLAHSGSLTSAYMMLAAGGGR